jgi:hypothetical protein
MARQEVKQKICDRCLKATLATTTISYSIGEMEYDIDVCEKHADMFQRDMLGWTRLSREHERPAFLGRTKVDLAAHNNTRVEVSTPRKRTETPHRPPLERPEVRVSWYLSSHAEERLEERGEPYGFTRADVFLCAQAPEQVLPHTDKEERWIYVRGRVACVVNRQTSTIVSVWPAAWAKEDNRVSA